MDQDKTTAISTMLSVRNGKKAIEFYCAAFGATEMHRIEAPDGSVVALLSIDEAEFWLADESPENANFSPEYLGGSSARMILTVSDPDAIFQRAVSAGGKAIWPVADQPYGWRVGRLEDPFGHHWEIARPLAGRE